MELVRVEDGYYKHQPTPVPGGRFNSDQLSYTQLNS